MGGWKNDDVTQVMERTEKLMMRTVVRYREDRDLENAIDFIQKKVEVVVGGVGVGHMTNRK